MHALTSHDVTVFLIVVGMMLILARFLFKVGQFFRIPTLVAELLAGIILGPTILGYVFPDLHSYFFPETGGLPSAYDSLFSLSVVMLLFLGGMEIDFSLVIKSKKSIAYTSLLAIVIPFVVGTWAGWHYFDFLHGFVFSAAPFVFPLTFGTIVALSALPLIVRLLMEYEVLNSPIGITTIGSALVTDLVGWCLFSSILIYANPTIENIQILYTIFYIIVFFAVMLAISSCKTFMANLFSQKGEQSYDISMLLGACFLSGAFTSAIQIHPTLGAFIAGIVCRRIVGDNTHILKQLEIFILNFFAPIFFISIGLKLNFLEALNIPMILFVFCLACVTKLIGAFLGASLSGFTARSAFTIGLLLNGRGAMEILMGAVALKIGLIGTQLFVTFVIVAVVTLLLVEPSIRFLLKKPS